ncbi:hypothetical protein [Halalkalicoccus ordinarius]|uniref:hypothetical protein n=1 Tax=Halalkalicoccus ordinarius TaxID=3116651 RepID=UPI00300E9209
MKRREFIAALALGVMGAPVAAQGDGEAYAGTNVSFDVDDRAVVDYQVGGALLFESVAVEAQSDHDGRSGAGVGADVELSAVTDLRGAALSMSARTETRATVETDGSAEMTAHDSERGQLVVSANGESQFVEAELGADATVETEDDRRAVVTTGDGGYVTAIVVGDGGVAVNGNDDLVADLDGNATVVFRASGEERSEDDEEAERLIADGEAAIEVYVDRADGEAVSDAVRYADDTSAGVRASAENTVEVTVDRTTDEGTVVLTSVSEAAIGATEEFSVTVDGEAATRVESAGELAGVADEGPAFAVARGASADANAEVLVAVDHFSERTIAMSADDETGDDAGGANAETQPGFGVAAALGAILAALLAGRR